MEAILFRLNKQTFAISLDDIDEILMMCALHDIPESPDFIAGTINLRGTMIPVLDLSKRLGYLRPTPPPPVQADEKENSPYQKDTRLLIVSVENICIGMIIDGLQTVSNLNPDDHHESIVSNEVLPDYIDGMHVDGAGIVQMIHIKHAVLPEELSILRNT